MKNKWNDLIKIIKKNETTVAIGVISLITLIIGTLATNFLIAFLIVFTIDATMIIINIITKRNNNPHKKEVEKKMTKKETKKAEKVTIKKQETRKTKPKKEKIKQPKKNKAKEIFKIILIIGFILAILVLILGMVFLGYVIKNAPEFSSQQLYNKEATFLYDIDGDEFAKLGSEMRQKISYEDLSESLIDAIIATEDSRYFQHSGVDLPRFLKASVSQVLGKGGGGASTITMQVSKNAFTSTEDEGIEGIIRKFSDIYISVFKIETHYTKEQIIEFYVNSNYLGGGAYGVEQASLNYFGKTAKELNIAESAMIAGMFQAPHGYDPYIYPEDCEERRQTVLYLMLRHGYITQEEYDIAKELTVEKLLIGTEESDDGEKYQAFINTVVEEVIDRTGYDPYMYPMKIYTTMNTKMQDNMNDVMNGVTYKWKNDYVQSASIVLDVKTGAITAVGGGRNVTAKGYNLATQMVQQIGSTAKPLYDYGPAIEYNNWSTYTPITDEPYSYSSGMALKNWDSKFENFTTLHMALKHSRNIPALKAFQSVKNSNIKQFVTNLGLSPEIDASGKIHEAHSLGGYNGETPLTLAAAYAAISNGGYYIEPHSFTIIEFTDSGDVFEVKPIKRRAMSTETSYMLAKVLEDTSSYAVRPISGINYAAKSGTTNLSSADIKKWKLPSNAIREKWIASFNDSYAITVWYGYEELSSEYYLTSNDYAIKDVFTSIAKKVYTKKSSWTQPSGVVEVTVEDGLPEAMLASANTPDDLKIKAYFKKGFEPTSVSTRFSQLNNVTNLNYDEKTNTLSWQPINTPNFLDSDYLTNLYDPFFKDSNTKYLNEQVNTVLEYNKKNVGTVVYDIYVKDSSGNLVYINSTDSSSYIYPIKETTTFVVKVNYTILKDCESSGAEFTITKIPVVITSAINGESTININVGDTYTEPSKPVTVLENGLTDITSNCTITTSILRKSDNQTFNDISLIDTSKADTYVITYNITYNEYTNSLNRTINIVNIPTEPVPPVTQ